MDDETYQAFMSDEGEGNTGENNKPDPIVEVDDPEDDQTSKIELSDYEFVQDKTSGNWMMNDTTYKKMIKKVFD